MIDPVKLCCFRKQSEHNGALCPTGTVMCCLCFNTFFPHQLVEVEDGSKIDVCLNCAAHEEFMIQLCDWIKALQDKDV